MSETIERDCMSCEQTFTTTNEENADFCPKCRKVSEIPETVPVKPTEPRKWKTLAGPIQSKKVRKALEDINWEGRTYTELSGVIGGEEHSFSFTQVWGGQRADSIKAAADVAAKFDWTVTRDNYQAIIDECVRQVAELRKNRPVKDTRRTPEQEAERIQRGKELAAKRAAEEAERKAAHEVVMAEQRAKEQALRAASMPPGYKGNLAIGSTGSVRYSEEHDGVEIVFEQKPERNVLATCKRYGFRWSPRSHVWYRKFTPDVWKVACQIAGVDELPAPASQNTDPAGAYVQAQEDAQQDAIAAAIGA